MPVTKADWDREREYRIRLFNRLMEENRLDAILCHANGAMAFQASVKYMTGLWVPCGRIFSMMEYGKDPVTFAGRIDVQTLCQEQTFLKPESVLLVGNLLEELSRRIGAMGEHPRIGIPGMRDCPDGFMQYLRTTNAELIDITDAFVKAKAPKTRTELTLIREAGDLALAAFEDIVRTIRPGQTEKQIIGRAEGYLRANGAEQTLVLTRSAKPHYFIDIPTFKPVGPDDVFVFSSELAGVGGYWTQIIRPIFMSRQAHPDAYDVLCKVKEAIQAGVEQFRPGRTIRDISLAVRRVADKYGLAQGVWAGHGMGVDLGDGIDIGESNEMEIVPNMILTLHPNLMSPTDGVLYADTFCSTEGAAVNLTGKYTDSPYLEDLRAQIG